MFIEFAIGAGLIWGVSKLVRKANASDKLTVNVTGRVHKITFSKITVICDALVKNPTQQTFRFRRPFVTLKYKGKTLGNSDVQAIGIELPAYKETTIKNFVIDIELLQLPAVLLDAFNILKTAKGNLQLEVVTLIPIITPAGDVPVTYQDTIVL
ncbi:MAG: hypothetical protein IM607_12570 [Cytophagales bacterium]|nr:hypothetical protein [Cytophagales bacterium]